MILRWQPAVGTQQRMAAVLLQRAGEWLERAVKVEHHRNAISGPGQQEHVIVLGKGGPRGASVILLSCTRKRRQRLMAGKSLREH